MSKFSLLYPDSALWVPTTSATWGALDFCPKVMHFWVCTITQGQLTALAQAGAWGDVEKPHQDVVFLLIVPSLAVGCEWVFRLTTVWMHPHQVCLPTLADVAQKLLLLADEGVDWPYAYIRMNDAMAHMPLSSEGYIGLMTSGLPSQNAYACLYQLYMWQLLQWRGWVVCPDGLNGGLEPLVFNFRELPLWNAASVGKSSRDPSMMELDLGNMVHAASPSTQAEDPLSLSSGGTMEQLPLASLAALTVPHLQDTNTINGPGSSSPNRGNREFSSIGENRTHHPCPNGNCPTQQGLHSPGNPIQPLSWLCPVYPANQVQNTRCREHFPHQATSSHLRKGARQPIQGTPSAAEKGNHCFKEVAHG